MSGTNQSTARNNRLLDFTIGEMPILLSGGFAHDTGGLTIDYTAIRCIIDKQDITLPPDSVTHSAGDVTNDRIDLCVVISDPSGSSVSIIEGIAAPIPVRPDLNVLETLVLYEVLVPSGAATLTFPTELVYDEDVEWTSSTNDAGEIDLASTDDPHTGTVSVEGTDVSEGTSITLTEPGAGYTIDPATTLQFRLKTKERSWGRQAIEITLYNASTRLGNPVYVRPDFFGLDVTNLDDHQLIVIPISILGIDTGSVITSIQIIKVSDGTLSGFFIDDIKFVEGMFDPPLRTTVTSPIKRKTNPTVRDDIKLGFFVGSMWLNTALNTEYVCLDVQEEAAVWKLIVLPDWIPPRVSLAAVFDDGAAPAQTTNAVGAKLVFRGNMNDAAILVSGLSTPDNIYDGSDIGVFIQYQLSGVAPIGGDDIQINCGMALIAIGGNADNAPVTSNPNTIVVDAQNVDQLYLVQIGTISGLTSAEVLHFRIRRVSQGGGSDTYPGDVDLYRVKLQVV